MMVGPYGDSVKYPYDEPLFLIPECDGVRILSNTYMEFLERLSDATVSIFKIGSTTPAAMLYDALDHFDKRSSKVNKTFISLILHAVLRIWYRVYVIASTFGVIYICSMSLFQISEGTFLSHKHLTLCVSQADENIRLIISSLPEAVKACIDAAGHEFDISQQRTLMRAAAYGRAFCRSLHVLRL